MARIEPLAPPYEPDVEEQLVRMMPPGTPPIALFRTLAKNLPMACAMHGWGSYELGRSLSLNLRDREIVIDRTCARSGCEYEWGVHVAYFADRAHLDAPQIASLAFGDAGDPVWTLPRERLLIRAADELHDTDDLSDRLWAELRAEFSDRELLDLVLLCGWYRAICYVARAARLAPEPWAPTFAAVLAGGGGGQR
mgnify:CR=1 FL=1